MVAATAPMASNLEKLNRVNTLAISYWRVSVLLSFLFFSLVHVISPSFRHFYRIPDLFRPLIVFPFARKQTHVMSKHVVPSIPGCQWQEQIHWKTVEHLLNHRKSLKLIVPPACQGHRMSALSHQSHSPRPLDPFAHPGSTMLNAYVLWFYYWCISPSANSISKLCCISSWRAFRGVGTTSTFIASSWPRTQTCWSFSPTRIQEVVPVTCLKYSHSVKQEPLRSADKQ